MGENGDDQSGEEEQDNQESIHGSTTDTTKAEVNIVDLITEGQELLVQVAKSPIGTKGARITSHTHPARKIPCFNAEPPTTSAYHGE